MKISDDNLGLLDEIMNLFSNTHQDEGDLWDEVCQASESGEHVDIYGLLEECRDRMNNTHCYDTEIYNKLSNL